MVKMPAIKIFLAIIYDLIVDASVYKHSSVISYVDLFTFIVALKNKICINISQFFKSLLLYTWSVCLF